MDSFSEIIIAAIDKVKNAVVKYKVVFCAMITNLWKFTKVWHECLVVVTQFMSNLRKVRYSLLDCIHLSFHGKQVPFLGVVPTSRCFVHRENTMGILSMNSNWWFHARKFWMQKRYCKIWNLKHRFMQPPSEKLIDIKNGGKRFKKEKLKKMKMI